jgi:hypothetical protein
LDKLIKNHAVIISSEEVKRVEREIYPQVLNRNQTEIGSEWASPADYLDPIQ